MLNYNTYPPAKKQEYLAVINLESSSFTCKAFTDNLYLIIIT